MFNFMPLVALASVCAAGMLLPFWHLGHNSFPGDLLVMAYLLAIPSFTMFLAGWFSVSPFALIGASRVLTQLFAYEVPFFLALLTPSLISGSWQLSDIQAFPWWHGAWWNIALRIIAQTIALLVALTCLQAKLERVPFDAPEAETEVVAGCLTEYSGKKLGIFRLQKSILMYVGAGLLATVFLPSFPGLGPVFGGFWLLFKIVLVVALLSGIRASFARIRIDQIVTFSWKYLAPLSLVQFFIVLVLRANQVVLP
jgi:NADH-quinone oxidoreductase subunit H